MEGRRETGGLFLQVRAGDGGGASMLAAFHPRSVEDGAVSRVFVQNLAFEDAAVFEREMEDVPLRRIRHRIELYNRRHSIQGPQAVTHATQVAVTTM